MDNEDGVGLGSSMQLCVTHWRQLEIKAPRGRTLQSVTRPAKAVARTFIVHVVP